MLMVHACDEANARRGSSHPRMRRRAALRCVVQVASHIVANPQDKTEVTLVFGNVSEDDILIKDLLDGLAEKDPKRFKVGSVCARGHGFEGHPRFSRWRW